MNEYLQVRVRLRPTQKPHAHVPAGVELERWTRGGARGSGVSQHTFSRGRERQLPFKNSDENDTEIRENVGHKKIPKTIPKLTPQSRPKIVPKNEMTLFRTCFWGGRVFGCFFGCFFGRHFGRILALFLIDFWTILVLIFHRIFVNLGSAAGLRAAGLLRVAPGRHPAGGRGADLGGVPLFVVGCFLLISGGRFGVRSLDRDSGS